MEKKQVIEQLNNVHENVQQITIGIANIYGEHELVIAETEHTFQTISFGKLGGVMDSVYPKSDFYFKRIPSEYESFFDLMNEVPKFQEFMNSI